MSGPGALRRAQSRGLGPLASRLADRGVAPRTLTLAGLAAGLGCALAVAVGRFGVAAALWAAACLCDALDGPVARAGGTESPRGARLDTMCDRVVDAAPLVGFVVLGRSTLAALAALSVVWLPALVAQLADRRGVTARGGPLGRAQRAALVMVVLCVPAWSTPLLWALGAGVVLTVLWRCAQLLDGLRARGPRPGRARQG